MEIRNIATPHLILALPEAFTKGLVCKIFLAMYLERMKQNVTPAKQAKIGSGARSGSITSVFQSIGRN